METYEDKLARWWNTLNGWEWPNDLPNKPEGFDSMDLFIDKSLPFRPNKGDWIDGIMDEIEKRIGHKSCLKWHHIHNIGWTEQQHEEWWIEHGKSR